MQRTWPPPGKGWPPYSFKCQQQFMKPPGTTCSLTNEAFDLKDP
jgi:hypothetical protein